MLKSDAIAVGFLRKVSCRRCVIGQKRLGGAISLESKQGQEFRLIGGIDKLDEEGCVECDGVVCVCVSSCAS